MLNIKLFLSELKQLQSDKSCSLACPRCGKDNMNSDMQQNSLSKYADVYICSNCSQEETLDNSYKIKPLSLSEWKLIKIVSSGWRDEK